MEGGCGRLRRPSSEKKHIFEYSYQYARRITSRLIKIAHFLEIFEVQGNAPLGIFHIS